MECYCFQVYEKKIIPLRNPVGQKNKHMNGTLVAEEIVNEWQHRKASEDLRRPVSGEVTVVRRPSSAGGGSNRSNRQPRATYRQTSI